MLFYSESLISTDEQKFKVIILVAALFVIPGIGP
jgi:hypothetical protein